jgi:hypothetical protein
MSNSKIMYYVNRFNEIFNGSPWYGETFEAKVNGITDVKAFVQPFNVAHSVAEIVAHMTYWRKGLVARLEGDNTFSLSMEDADNWVSIEKLKGKGWKKIVDDFNESQNKIIHLLPRKTDDFLKDEYSKGSSYEYLIQGIIDHDIYHLGQIGLIKRLNQG